MLRRSDGATIAQIVEATGWQPHTVRGAFAGALKKRLGLDRHLREDQRSPGLPHRSLTRAARKSAAPDRAAVARSDRCLWLGA